MSYPESVDLPAPAPVAQGRIALPRPPDVPAPVRMPVIAVLAPIVASVALWAITRSATALIFAGLGPVVAVATTVDARLHRRRARREESRRFAADCTTVRGEIDAAVDALRSRAETEHPAGVIRAEQLEHDPGRWATPFDARLALRLGTATRASGLEVDQVPADSRDPAIQDAYAGLRGRASLITGAPLVVCAGAGVGFAGPDALVQAAARSVIVQVAVACSPERVTLEGASGWMTELPHARDVSAAHPTFRSLPTAGNEPHHALVVATASAPTGLPRALGVVVHFDPSGRAQLARGGGESSADPIIDLLGLEAATAAAARLHRAASAEGIARAGDLPELVALRDVEFATGATQGERGLRCALGLGLSGAVEIDLTRDGPHAVVGGTTGSGKSELLLSWILGMAHDRGPEEVTFLFVDFKGGAAFEPLAALPHCVGVITDLDPAQSLRALGSLAAELRFRERALAHAGLRSIDDATPESMPFPRLVVVVDEYATLVDRQQELHTAFSDIAARGRSLGVHLILCTQRPAGVVRDAILANCALRVSLRVHSQADSVAVIGTDAAALLPARPLGRAVISRGGGPPELIQVARSDPADLARICGASAPAPRPRRPWLPPLAPSIPLPVTSGHSPAPDGTRLAAGMPVGMVDRPEFQQQEVICWHPRQQGSLLVTGAGRSGKSGVIAAIEAAHGGYRCSRVGPGVAALWDAVTDALDHRPADGHPADDPPRGDSTAHGRVLLVDDLDVTLAACPQDYETELLDALARLLREGPSAGVWCVITVQRVSAGLHTLGALCGSTLVLRMSSRTEHVAAGGESSRYESALPPGAGWWQGDRVQVFDVAHGAVATAEQNESPAATSPPRHVGARHDRISATAPLAAVSTAPARFARILAAARPGARVIVLSDRRPGEEYVAAPADEDAVLVADPQQWQGHWSLLAASLRARTVLFDGCGLAELRAVTGRRDLPPPFDRGERPLWSLSPGGDFRRARLGAREDAPQVTRERQASASASVR